MSDTESNVQNRNPHTEGAEPIAPEPRYGFGWVLLLSAGGYVIGGFTLSFLSPHGVMIALGLALNAAFFGALGAMLYFRFRKQLDRIASRAPNPTP